MNHAVQFLHVRFTAMELNRYDIINSEEITNALSPPEEL